MENLKIKVNSPEESARAQLAFFELGAKWFPSMCFGSDESRRISPAFLDKKILLLHGDSMIIDSAIYPEFDDPEFKEITLPELEEMVTRTDKRLKEIGEQIFENDFKGSDGWKALKRFKKKEKRAQERFEAAELYLKNQCRDISGELGKAAKAYYYYDIEEALHIAAGLEPIPTNDTKPTQ